MLVGKYTPYANTGNVFEGSDYDLVELMALNESNRESSLCSLTRDRERFRFLEKCHQNNNHYYFRLTPSFEIVASATIKPYHGQIIEFLDGSVKKTPEGAVRLFQVGVHQRYRHQGFATQILKRIRTGMEKKDGTTAMILTAYEDDGVKYLQPIVRRIFADAPIPVYEYDSDRRGYRDLRTENFSLMTK